MKRLLLAASLTMVVSFCARAATVSFDCIPFPAAFFNGNGGPTPVSCPGSGLGAGNTLNAVTLNEGAAYAGISGSETVVVTFTPAGPAAVTWNPTTATATVNSGSVNVGTMQQATSGVTLANFTSAFNVSVSSTVTHGNVVLFSYGAVNVTYDYTSASTVPEPSSVVLSGFGCVGLWLACRRRRARD